MILDYIRSHIPGKVHITGPIVATWLLPVDPLPTCRGQLLLKFCLSHCFAEALQKFVPAVRQCPSLLKGNHLLSFGRPLPRACIKVSLCMDFTVQGCPGLAVCHSVSNLRRVGIKREQTGLLMWNPKTKRR